MNRALGPVCRCIFLLGVWLLLAVSARNPCDLKISGPVPLFAEYGKTVPLNCTMTCPSTSKGWETSLRKLELSEGSFWTATTVAIREWVSYPQCYVIDMARGITVTNTTIKAYQPPDNVSIALAPVMQVGRPYLLTCWVQAVALKEYLTVFVRKGNATLHAARYPFHVTGNESFSHSQVIIAQRTDHGAEYTCLARLDLTPNGELFERSASVLVHTFDLPKEPTIHVLEFMELGSFVTATCEVAEAFPLEDVKVALLFDGRELNVTVTRAGDMLALEGAVPSDWSGKHMLECRATASPHGEAKRAKRFVYIYSFPEPYLNIQDVNTLAGQDVNITCALPESDPREVLVAIRGNTTLKTCKGRAAISCSHILRIQKEDHRRKITCEVTVGFLNITKTASLVLNVAYAPEFRSSLCFDTHTWVEGAQAMLSCEADGNPPPHVQCTDEAGVNVTGYWSEITRNQSGIYQCLATNKHGRSAINVTARVEYGPAFSEFLCPSTLKWVEGVAATFSCEADGRPTPRVECTKDGGPSAIRPWPTVTRHDAGTYRCNTSNRHGVALKNVAVRVEYKPEFSDTLCPSSVTWMEGTEATFACHAGGNPVPHIDCIQEGGSKTVTNWSHITRHNFGTYQCYASNRHGFDVKNVTVSIEYGPEFTDVLCPSSQMWVEDQGTFTCGADGNPAPVVECFVDGGPNARGHGPAISTPYSGLYQCKASNVHGFALKNVTVVIQYAPAFTDALCPTTLTWVEGSPATFSCKADGNPTPLVKCTKDGRDKPIKQWHQISRNDSGSYLCSARNSHGSDARNVEVVVEYRPEITDSLCPSHLTWIEGTPAAFSCRTDGNPVPRIECTKDGGKNAIGDWLKVERESSGSYQCIATNKHGSEVKAVTVTVEYKPDIPWIEVSPSEIIYRGQKVTLTCQAKGLPGPTYHWRTPYNSSLTYSPDNSAVTIMDAKFQHGGVYECEVQNRHGSDRQQKEIHVKDTLPIILGAVIGALALAVVTGISAKIYLLHRAEISQKYQVSRAREVAKEENPANTYTKVAQFQICDT